MNRLQYLVLVIAALILWSAAALAETCQEKVNSSGAYVFSHSVPIGNGIVECYVKARDGTGEPIKDSIAFEDEPVGDAPAGSAGGAQPSPPPEPDQPPKDCNYEFKKAEKPMGDDGISNLLCEEASSNSPSFLVYPRRSDGKLGKQLTEVDALLGQTWYECKCGYLSTVEGAKKGKASMLKRLEGPDGLDKKIRTQASISAECGYEYRLAVANPTVAEFFRERYSFVKTVEEIRFDACE